MRWLVKLARRARLLVARRSVEREMDEEMQYHLAEAARELEREGASSAAARRGARLAFGGVELAKEDARDARGGRWFDDLVADLRYAIRQAARAPGHAVAVVGILAVSVAGASVAIALARAYLFRPLPYPHPDRLVSVIFGPSREPFPNPPNLADVDWRPAEAVFETTATWDLDGFTLVGGGAPPEYVLGSWVSPGFFALRGTRPVLGRLFHPEEYQPGATVAVISNELWRSRFGGNPGIVGTTVRTHSTDRPDEDALVTIVGVLPPAEWRLRFTDVLRPLGTSRTIYQARLPEGISADEAAARLTAIVRSQLPNADPAWRLTLVSSQEDHVRSIRPVLEILIAAAILLLVLVQANIGALLVARGTTRANELAVRRALGASRGRLVRQFTIEAAVLGGAGLGLGLALTTLVASSAARWIETVGGVTVPGGVGSVGLDVPVIAAVTAATGLTFLLLALVPVLGITRTGPTGLLTSARVTTGRGPLRARRALATVQVAVAVALLAQGALLVRSIRSMVRTDLGFAADELLKASLLLPRSGYPDAPSRGRILARVLERVRATPGVVNAAGVIPPPFRNNFAVPVECDGCASGGGAVATPQTVTREYFQTMGIPLVEGRPFEPQDGLDRGPVAVVSEALARRLWSGTGALGRRVRVVNRDAPGDWLTVVGVVRDIRKTYSDSLYPDLYRSFEQQPVAYPWLMVRTTGDTRALAESVRRAVAAEDETLALSEIEPMSEVLSGQRGRNGIVASFVSGVAGLAFCLTIVGLYAVVAYLVRVRRREFAVRVALGALPRQIAALVVGEAKGMLGVGMVAGIALALATVGLSRSYLVGVSPHDPATYAAVVMVVGLVALAALAIPARGAAEVDPATTLREE